MRSVFGLDLTSSTNTCLTSFHVITKCYNLILAKIVYYKDSTYCILNTISILERERPTL